MAGTNLTELELERGRRRRLLARCGAVLFIGGGALGLLADLPELLSLDHLGAAAVSAVAVVLGIAAWFAPWERWPDWASLVLVPPALALIAVGAVLGPRTAYDYGVYFMVVHVWIGLAHRPRTSLFVAPLTMLAYALPLPFIAADPTAAVVSGIVVVPLCALVGEAVSWVTRQLEATEVSERDARGLPRPRARGPRPTAGRARPTGELRAPVPRARRADAGRHLRRRGRRPELHDLHQPADRAARSATTPPSGHPIPTCGAGCCIPTTATRCSCCTAGRTRPVIRSGPSTG